MITLPENIQLKASYNGKLTEKTQVKRLSESQFAGVEMQDYDFDVKCELKLLPLKKDQLRASTFVNKEKVVLKSLLRQLLQGRKDEISGRF